MRKLSYEKIKDHTSEKWAEDFAHIVHQLLVNREEVV